MSWDDAIDGVDRDTPGGRMPRAWNVAARLRAANDDIVHAQQADGLPAYAELHCLSDFSFLRGASSAEQLFARAQQCGYSALAITDECSLAGIVRGLEASRATGVRLIVGSEFTLVDGTRFVLLVENAHGYPQLCGLITTARRAASKGAYRLDRAEVQAQFRDVAPGVFALWLPGAQPQAEQGAWLQQVFGERAFLAVELHREQDDVARLHVLQALAQQLGMTALASGDVHMAQRRERIVQDTLTAIRHTLPLAECGAHLFRNGERHLRTRRALGNIYPDALLQATVELAQRCTFDISKISYTYPRELVPEGHTPTSYLRQLTEAGIRRRWPGGITAKVREDIEKELALIALKKYEAFFLTVQDVVRFAREQNILCQGRGSSANSAVCYALGITAVNPDETRLLMARFLSEKRDEPPDIDVDFEHERREEVLQYVYSKYGRERAALAATVICYRGKSAVRDVAKAFGLPPDQIALLANCYGWGNGETPMDQRIEEAGFDLANPLINKILAVTEHLRDHPRHLSQHVGGFVISDEPLSLLVPVENAAMANRTIIQWDKDDLETMKLLKVDCLALGMLTCIRKTLDLVRGHRGRNYSIATLPGGDAPTYKMIQRADTVGVFQIESRAQMAMLPRLKPAAFYDLVIEVAIVRPGPIQGDMVHPYLRRRQGREEVNYPSPAVEDILKPTLGVPLFQEQVMELLMHAADYSEDEADNLRRSMAAWRRGGDMEQHRTRVRERMQGKGYASSFIDQIFEQIKGFGSYGFPQSHAASFAKLVYASCWLKRHEPAAFACGLLNAQPMGFYSASQIVQDARRGSPERERVEVLPVDVLHSDWNNTLVGGRPWRSAADPGEQPAIRLGMRQVAGLSQVVAQRIVAARTQRAFADIGDLCLRAALDEKARLALAEAGALQGMVGNRNAARWAMAGVEARRPLLPGSPEERPVEFEAPRAGEEILADYRSVGLSLRQHPMALLRPQMRQRRILGLRELQGRRHGSGVHVAGLVTQRQRPATAKGTIFVTLEDEQGMINVIVWSHLALRRRRALLESRLLAVRGRWERVDGVEHLIAGDLYDLSNLLGDMQLPSRDFH
ncbi:error-prone DNA polymerase [Xanthomonas citri]|nr:error-prone DNA polymerase [Xanthomonas citri]MBD1471715.1 error-prone DNA polymerase [Xanthomonas citri pv. citri]MBD1475453.1 error-prone DNA polymerase [Xanthomonas citri pv. citri]MBD1485743.1 error-prone DNA polymerase [Xanthomonas citri pv. citri]MBD1494480.1 error-prone DNA polymerase [Xanthomonas citri pv. citri]MBD1498729.1 error-prone DNA polymerase [Xanthomonas citri pv. citri]